jgi:hypothetical protein
MTKTTELPVRLAIRVEGGTVNAYLAKQGTMDGAMLIGSIARGIVEKDRRLWENWKAVMTDAISSVIKGIFDQEPEMIERPAPEHERAGHG